MHMIYCQSRYNHKTLLSLNLVYSKWFGYSNFSTRKIEGRKKRRIGLHSAVVRKFEFTEDK